MNSNTTRGANLLRLALEKEQACLQASTSALSTAMTRSIDHSKTSLDSNYGRLLDHEYAIAESDNPIAAEDHKLSHVRLDRKSSDKASRLISSMIADLTTDDDDSLHDEDFDVDKTLASDSEDDVTFSEEFVEAGSWMNISVYQASDNSEEPRGRLHEPVPGPVMLEPHTDQVASDEVVSCVAPKKQRSRSAIQKIDRNKTKYKLLPPCSESCRNKCQSKLDENHREGIRLHFWSGTFSERRIWLHGHITLLPVKQKRSRGKKPPRTFSRKYYIPSASNEKIEVCKKMFLSTLGLKTDAMITGYMRATAAGVTQSADNRGKHPSKNKLCRSSIVSHIESCKPQVSHYKLENAPNRRYLDLNITRRDMLTDFNSRNGTNVSYSVYRQVFDSLNIGFSKPSQDECSVCVLGSSHEHDSLGESGCCNTCIVTKQHLEIAKEARHSYQEDSAKVWSPEEACYAVDVQKVIILPKMNVKEHFFISRLAVFNETFASLSGGDDLCILWHEGLSGRDASDVTSAYYKAIQKSTDATRFVFWADNCSAQNKNWTLYSGLVSIVNCEHGPDDIVIKYFEPGHTFMRADSVHGSIGKAMKREEQILDWEDFLKLVNKSSAAATAVELTDFFNVPDYHRPSTRHQPMPLLKDIRVVAFNKGSTALHYKNRITDSNYQSTEFLEAKICKKPESMWTGRMKDLRGIQSSKKNILIEKLVPLMPPRKKEFWRNLQTSDNVPDLVTDRDPQEVLS